MRGMWREISGGELVLYCEVLENSVGYCLTLRGGYSRSVAMVSGYLHVLRVGMEV